MGAAKLGVVATFLSDPLISGFTTGSAVFVVVSQLKHILGLTVPQITGPLASVKVRTLHELILFFQRPTESLFSVSGIRVFFSLATLASYRKIPVISPEPFFIQLRKG